MRHTKGHLVNIHETPQALTRCHQTFDTNVESLPIASVTQKNADCSFKPSFLITFGHKIKQDLIRFDTKQYEEDGQTNC